MLPVSRGRYVRLVATSLPVLGGVVCPQHAPTPALPLPPGEGGTPTRGVQEGLALPRLPSLLLGPSVHGAPPQAAQGIVCFGLPHLHPVRPPRGEAWRPGPLTSASGTRAPPHLRGCWALSAPPWSVPSVGPGVQPPWPGEGTVTARLLPTPSPSAAWPPHGQRWSVCDQGGHPAASAPRPGSMSAPRPVWRPFSLAHTSQPGNPQVRGAGGPQHIRQRQAHVRPPRVSPVPIRPQPLPGWFSIGSCAQAEPSRAPSRLLGGRRAVLAGCGRRSREAGGRRGHHRPRGGAGDPISALRSPSLNVCACFV